METMARLTTVHGLFAARVLAARLEDEGFDVELRGALHSPYGLTIGDLSRVDVYVPSGQVDEASLVLLVTDVDEALGGDEPPLHRRTSLRWRIVAAAVVVGATAPLVLRLGALV